MTAAEYVLCLDCGATNVRAMLVDRVGNIISKASQPNATFPGEESSDYHIWDDERIFQQLIDCTKEAIATLKDYTIKAVTITTFGVDGALVDAQGKPIYPVISWKCPRTAEIMAEIGSRIPQETLNQISGIGAFSFNTIYKLIWLKDHRPDLLQKAHSWLFISNLLAHKLTGQFTTDKTMAGTSQLTDLKTGTFSDEILNAIGISPSLFPNIVEAGETIGHISDQTAQQLDLPQLANIPVISTGHDTQFAIFGSGAKENQAVLSSGTWEILMARSREACLTPEDYNDGATAEFDSQIDLRNPGLQWIGSGIIEWVKDTCFRGENYDTMDDEAAIIPPGSEGVTVVPEFLASGTTHGSINGLILGRTRGHIYRATLEALTYKLKSRLKRLEHIGHFKAENLILVGGGAKNNIWTQMRADILGLPIMISTVTESTVLGASMFAWTGAGIYPSPESARDAFNISYKTFTPGKQQIAYSQLAQ